jgi:hypothetical protein
LTRETPLWTLNGEVRHGARSGVRWAIVSKDDGPFGGVLAPCDMCLEVGELVTLDGRPPQALRVGECPQCHGSGHVHIDCEEHEVDDVVRGLPPTRRQLAVRRMMAGVGMCTDCFGAGVVAQIECDADRSPIRYAEVPCPTCTATG